jgi:uncharacterized protein YeaO (DUF488 family)
MRESATLRLTDGREVAVELDSDDLNREQILVHRVAPRGIKTTTAFLEILDAHMATATPHPAGTTDRFIEEDRSREF